MLDTKRKDYVAQVTISQRDGLYTKIIFLKEKKATLL